MKDNEGSLTLDQIDLRILERLQIDGRMTNQELAEAVGLSPSPCLNRVRRLEKTGVISSYQAHIELTKVCRHVDVIAAVTLNSHGLEDFQVFEKMVEDNKQFIAHDNDGDTVFLTRLQWDIDRVIRDYPGIKLTATKELMV